MKRFLLITLHTLSVCVQEDVHKVLAFTAQAMHDLTPPEVGSGIVRVIADRFISDRSDPRAIAIGLHAGVYLVCMRTGVCMLVRQCVCACFLGILFSV